MKEGEIYEKLKVGEEEGKLEGWKGRRKTAE